jgi:VWFA-related protein
VADAGEDVPIFKSDSQLVDLYASVVDKNGKMVLDIPKSAFKVYEDGVEQAITRFGRQDVPVSLGLIIDNSGSMKEKDKRARVEAASLAMVKASNPQDEVFVVDFNDDAYLDQDFTSDIKKLESALDRLDPRGGTAMREAISLSIDKVKMGTRDKKVLVVVTDGNDNNDSGINLEQLIKKAQQSEVLIYTVGLLSDEEPHEQRSARRALKELAEASGGQDYYPKDVAEVDKIMPEVAHDVRNQYLLAYTPTNSALDGKFRAIKVKVNGFGNPTVRTRNGYYAKPAPGTKNTTQSKAPPPPVK